MTTNQETAAAFVEHIGKLLVLAGDAQEKSTAEATTIMALRLR